MATVQPMNLSIRASFQAVDRFHRRLGSETNRRPLFAAAVPVCRKVLRPRFDRKGFEAAHGAHSCVALSTAHLPQSERREGSRLRPRARRWAVSVY